jgi:hypothetical protein
MNFMNRCSSHNDEWDERFDALLQSALNTYESRQLKFNADIKDYKSWNYELESCQLTLRGDGITSKSFNLIPIATYSPSKQNWMWIWANDSFPSRACEKSARLKLLADKTKYRIFVSPIFNVTLHEIDELCALSLQELNGRGIFKVKQEDPWIFFVVEDDI